MKISLKVNGLGKRFNREWIFRKLNFDFESGNTYAITGPNGSGKSTLMQVLWGQSLPTSGSLNYFNGETSIPVEELHNHLSIATPYMDLIDEMTLDEQIEFHFKIRKIRDDLKIEELPSLLYLESSRKKQIGNFSSGMRQRVKLGLAFFTNSDILFLDEPGTNLDKQAFGWYLENLRKFQIDRLTIIASNNPDEYPGANKILNIADYK